MPVAIALIILVVVLAVCLIGILWTLIFVIPFYAAVGIVVCVLWRVSRNQRHMATFVQREAERQRLLNEQEMNAWRSAIERDRRDASKPDRVQRSIDRSRDPQD